MRALDGTVPAWNENYNPETDRYEVGFFFDSMPRWRKDMISSKLAEFGEQTCVDFVNLEDDKTRPEFQNRLKIVNGGGCWSYVGRHHKVQVGIYVRLYIRELFIVLYNEAHPNLNGRFSY